MATNTATENLKTGWQPYYTWEVHGAGDLANQGFARQLSVNIGETVQFSCVGDGTRIDIFRMGWYQGHGFHMADQITNTPTTQPEATIIPNSNGATTCTAWSVTATWEVPADAASGLYIAVFHNAELTDKSWMPFIVRDDNAEVDIIYKTSEATWGAAYNHYGTIANPTGGKNVYGQGAGVGNIQERCYAASYHRPNITKGYVSQTYFMACEAPLIRFLERNGYSIKYVTSEDLDRNPALLDKGKIFLSSGHDEYWSTPMRDAVENWRDTKAGRSIFMSGNEVFWRTRYQYNGDETIMWCHKDTMPGPGGHVAGTPLDPVEWTGTWKDTRWPNNRPEWLLTGTDFRLNGINDLDATILRNPYAGHKVWGGTSLNDGDITLTRVIGFEADEMRPTQPADSVKVLAAYTRNINGAHADDNGQNYTDNGDLEWGIISQRYAGGGLTIGFGTCQWSWTLDSTHDRGTGTEVSPAAQQFTINLLRDLGANPETLMSGMTLRTATPLDEYGIDPAAPTAPTAGTYDYQGNPLAMYQQTNGQLQQIWAAT